MRPSAHCRWTDITLLVQTSGVWEGGAPVGGTFKVEWKRRLDLPFESTHHMYNPLNEGKPVRICRDGQEVPHELGQQLTRMMDQMALEQGIPPPRPAANAMQPAGAASSPLSQHVCDICVDGLANHMVDCCCSSKI